jgi:hypothetical protein
MDRFYLLAEPIPLDNLQCYTGEAEMDFSACDTTKQIAIVEQDTGASRRLTKSDVIRQNTAGMSEGFPAGVPVSFNWYKGWNNDGQKRPPAGFSAVTGWGQIYHKVGQPFHTDSNATVEVANARTYVHLSSTKEWVLVQDQATNPLSGGHFVTDFRGNAAIPMRPLATTEGYVAFNAPPLGYNNHFWPTARGTFADGKADAVYVQMDMRASDLNSKLVASVGADWWRDANAPYFDDHSNNPGAGSSNWVELSTEWKTVAFHSMNAKEFQAHSPPFLFESVIATTPKITSFSFHGGTAGDETSNTAALTLTGKAEPGSTVRVFDNHIQIGAVQANANCAWSFTSSKVANGDHRFTANASGSSGNVSSMSSELTVKIDARWSRSTKR